MLLELVEILEVLLQAEIMQLQVQETTRQLLEVIHKDEATVRQLEVHQTLQQEVTTDRMPKIELQLIVLLLTAIQTEAVQLVLTEVMLQDKIALLTEIVR